MLSRGFAGLSLWDYGQRSPADLPYARHDPDFYRRDLESKLERFRHSLAAVELSQEAHYQDEQNRAWSQLDWWTLANFKAVLLGNRLMAVRTATQDVDLSDTEADHLRAWSVREAQRSVEFALALGADAAVLHPGTYNLRSGRFWPKPDEALAITNQRRVMFSQSLREIVAHFVEGVVRREREIAGFAADDKRAQALRELRGLGHALDLSQVDESARYRLLCEMFKIIEAHRLPVWAVRHALDPARGVHLALENVEPPNFLANTAGQLVAWHERMSEMYADHFATSGLGQEVFDRYRPMIALDPSHLLNSTVLLTQPANQALGHLFDDYERLFSPFVTLPCDLPGSGSRRLSEPILNHLVRRHGRDILYSHLSGCQKLGNTMTTHDPIKSFRSRMYMHVGPDGQPRRRYATGTFDPDVELNLEEVVQVVGFDRAYVLTVYERPDELLISSHAHVEEYLSYLYEEYRRSLAAVTRAVQTSQERVPAEGASAQETSARVWEAGRVLKDLEKARFYLKPHRHSRDLWKVGYVEGGFYTYQQGYDEAQAPSPVRIFATHKDATGAVWVDGVCP